MLKLFSSAKEMQGIQSHASMEGQGVFAQAVGNQTRIIVFYAGGNGQGCKVQLSETYIIENSCHI